MTHATLQELATSISRRLPLSKTVSSVVGSSDPLVQQLLEIMQELGDDLMEGHEWSRLINTWSFDVDSDPHTATFPDGYHRYLNEADFWRSGSDVTPMTGPVKSSDWHYIEQTPGTYPGYWRPYSTGVQVTGVPTDESCDIEYIANTWVLDADDVTVKPEFTADSDTIIFDNNMFKVGVRWMWKQSKGLDYAEDMATFERRKEILIAADRAARPLLTRRRIRDSYEARQFSWPGQVVET